MEAQSSVTVNFANLSYAFMKFQEQYKNLCQNISEEKMNAMPKNLKRLSSFIFEYLAFIKAKDMRTLFINHLDKINEELSADIEFIRLGKIPERTKQQSIVYNQKYYYYLIKLF
jgi:hypothetical protein